MCKTEDQKEKEATLILFVIVMFLFGMSLGVHIAGCDNKIQKDAMRTQIIQELEKK
jgi:putative exporter of polyketide antibiotics